MVDRIIEVEVKRNYLTKNNKIAGVQGEANVTWLRITFDEAWEGYAKKVTWWDALGQNPVEITLTTARLEDAAKSFLVYLCPIPGEALAEAGECSFIIDGYADGKRLRSVSDELEVKEAPFIEEAASPADPTPTQAEQLQEQIEQISEDIKKVAGEAAAAETALNAAADAQASALAAQEAKEAAERYSPTVEITEIEGGHRIEIADISGKKSVDVMDGAEGQPGKDGHTPEKGVDYWTEEEQSEIKSDVIETVRQNQKSASVTLAAAGWAGKSQTVNLGGVNANSIVVVSPDPAEDNFTAYAESGVRCKSQGEGTLTFICDEVPGVALAVNVAVLN